MGNTRLLVFAVIAQLPIAPSASAQASAAPSPDTVAVRSGSLTLRALLWKPLGTGQFPAVLFNHGSYTSDNPIHSEEPELLGPVFARHGYVFLFLFRRGIGLSADQGPADGDLMAQALRARGQPGRNEVQLQLLQGEELNEVQAGLEFLRSLRIVDARRVAVAGHSFGGSLSLVLGARDTSVRAVVSFAGSARSWDGSPELRARLLKAVRHAPAVFFIHAANDYSTAPGKTLAAEMRRLGRPQRLRIYPVVGSTQHEGHNLIYRIVTTWEGDVFGFLHEFIGPSPRDTTRGVVLSAGCLGGFTGGGRGVTLFPSGRLFRWSQPRHVSAERDSVLVKVDSGLAARLQRRLEGAKFQQIELHQPGNMSCFLSASEGSATHEAVWPINQDERLPGPVRSIYQELMRAGLAEAK
jgi:carboxymethylenebutenolidase